MKKLIGIGSEQPLMNIGALMKKREMKSGSMLSFNLICRDLGSGVPFMVSNYIGIYFEMIYFIPNF